MESRRDFSFCIRFTRFIFGGNDGFVEQNEYFCRVKV
jgi:hypothetical protein